MLSDAERAGRLDAWHDRPSAERQHRSRRQQEQYRQGYDAVAAPGAQLSAAERARLRDWMAVRDVQDAVPDADRTMARRLLFARWLCESSRLHEDR